MNGAGEPSPPARLEARPASAPPAASSLAFAGVTLAQFATIQAAVAARISLDDALAREGLAGADWPFADESWSTRIADDEQIADAFEEAYAEAAARHRKLAAPLDDQAQFSAFMRTLAAEREPTPWLAAKGLTLDDVTFALAHWTRRMKLDPAVGDRMMELLREESRFDAEIVPPPPAPPASVPLAPPAPPTEDDEPAPPPLFADLPTVGDEPEAVPELAAASTTTAEPSTARTTTVVPPPDVAAQTPSTQLPSYLRDRATATNEPAPHRSTAAPPPLRKSRAGATMMGVELPAAPALPFHPAAARGGPPSATAAPPESRAPSTQPSTQPRLDDTARIAALPRGDVLPFSAAGASAPRPPSGTFAAAPVSTRPDDPLAQTRPPSAPQIAATPFQAAPGAARPEDPLSVTMGAGPISRAPVTPFKASPGASADLEHYVELYAALARREAPPEHVLAQFGLTPSTKAGLDDYWERRFAAEPTLRTRWLEALMTAARTTR